MIHVRCIKDHWAGFRAGEEYLATKGSTMTSVMLTSKPSITYPFNLPYGKKYGCDFAKFFRVIPKSELKARYGAKRK